MENNWKAVGGLYTNCRDDFFSGILTNLCRNLKANKHDAAVLLMRRKDSESGKASR